MVLKIFRWFGILVFLGVLALVTLPLLPVAKDRLSAGPVQDYINEYACALHIGNDATCFVLPASVADARFVMLSEMHGFADVQAIDLMMVRKMAEERGTRIYLAELSPDQAIAFNAMVLDGDDSFALEVFEFWSGITAQWGNREFFAKLEALRDFNRGRAPAEKIVFIGTDKPSDPAFAARIAETTLPGPAPGFDSLEAVRAINMMLLAEALGRPDSASRYAHILPGIEEVLGLPGAEGETFYALWGLGHGAKVTIDGARPLAMRLNEEGALAGRVATIAATCMAGCFNMLPAAGIPFEPLKGPNGEPYTLLPMGLDNPYIIRARGADEVLGAMDDHGVDLMFLPLAEERSPYLDGPGLVGMTGYLAMAVPSFTLAYGAAAGEAWDAVFFMRNSPPLTPWRGEVFDISGQALAAY